MAEEVITKKKIRKKKSFTIASKEKYKEILLTKEAKYLCNGKCETLNKEMEEGTKEQKDILGSRVAKFNIVKTTLLTSEVYGLTAIPMKIPRVFFTELGQTVVKLTRKHERTDEVVLSREHTGNKIIVDLKLYESMELAEKQM